MYQWNKDFLANPPKIQPKTIFYGSTGDDIHKIVSTLVLKHLNEKFKKEIKQTQNLNDLALPNFFFLKKEVDLHIWNACKISYSLCCV